MKSRRKSTKSIFCTLVFMFMFVFISNISVNAVTTQTTVSKIENANVEIIATEFTKEFILQTVETDSESTWNEKTEIVQMIPLYDLNEIVNGYICVLNNDGKDAGSVQVSIINGKAYLVAFAFEGGNPLEPMLDFHYSDKNYKQNAKIIYNGGTEYLIKENNNYIDLMSNTSRSILLKKEIESDYKDFQLRMQQEDNKLQMASINLNNSSEVNATTSGTAIKKYVTNTINSTDMVIQDDWKGRTLNGTAISSLTVGTCGPTAGTNIIKYWALKRNVSKLDCPYSSYSRADKDWWIASGLMVKMNMNMTTGTVTASGIYNGLKSYSTAVRGVQYSGSDFLSKPLVGTNPLTYTKVKNIIDNNIPFAMAVPSHCHACFGYYITASGSEQVILQTTWDRAWHFYNFASLNAQNFLYVRWN